MQCTICQKDIEGIDTFGEIQRPMCMSCWFEVETAPLDTEYVVRDGRVHVIAGPRKGAILTPPPSPLTKPRWIVGKPGGPQGHFHSIVPKAGRVIDKKVADAISSLVNVWDADLEYSPGCDCDYCKKLRKAFSVLTLAHFTKS